uniref:Putative secreted protein n=1 Tax=Anopheles darlingi TaxID=43151 RepID=A0A2M4DFU4_ANODA
MALLPCFSSRITALLLPFVLMSIGPLGTPGPEVIASSSSSSPPSRYVSQGSGQDPTTHHDVTFDSLRIKRFQWFRPTTDPRYWCIASLPRNSARSVAPLTASDISPVHLSVGGERR